MQVGDDRLVAILAAGLGPDVTAPLAVAVSGGGDSMALLHLLHRMGRVAGAVTVNHGLRPAAADEAAMVAQVCAALCVPHDTLHWSGPAPVGNLMDQARRARLSLIAEWGRGRGLGHVALGHTADDQAETFLMELARKAGLDGLSGMRRSWAQDGVIWLRPLLAAGRAELRGYLRRHGVSWAEDPTNDDPAYARVRARQALAALGPLGITVEGLATVAGHLEASRAALDVTLQAALHGIVREGAGALMVDRAGFRRLPHDLQRRLLATTLGWVSGSPYPPRADALDRLVAAILQTRVATLAGCRVAGDTDQVRILREAKAAGGPAPVGRVWDHRWLVEGPPGTVRALGPKGLPQVKGWRALGISRDTLLVSPAVWDGDTLLAAPVAGMESGWKARIVAPFHRFPVSD